MRDYYEVLGVSRDADPDSIKKAYRKLALRYHPDRNGGDDEAENKFREATEAYEVLRDQEKRARYDRFGHAGVKSGAGARGGGFGGFGFEDALNIFMRDFGGFGGGFEDAFGGGRGGGRRVQRGRDIKLRLKLTLEEVANGARKTVRVRLLNPCDRCEGTGAADGAEAEVCETCQGRGQVRRVQQSVFGQVVAATTCPTCKGQGQQIRDVCTECRGDGRMRADETFDVDIPAGVTSENFLTLRGQGNVGPRGGPRGDIVVVLEVEDDPRFIRQEDDLIYELPLSFSQAALGLETTVPTIYGEESISVPAGTQSGEVLTLRGKGLPSLDRGRRGDQHVRVHVWTPTEVRGEQAELFRRLADLEGEPPIRSGGSRRSGFWTRMKEAFSA